MSISTSKSILITPGSFSSSNNAISQIDLKWVESGVGTFVFRPNVNDLRSTIYNWQQNSEPVILFGGMGTVNGVRKFAGPYQDYTGTFSGITSFPQIQFFPLSGTIYANTLTLSGIASFNQIYSAGLSTFGSINLLGPLYDQTFNSGSVNQVLTSTVNGVAWSTPSTYGNISGLGITNYVSKFSNSTSLTTSNIIDNGSLVTVGIGMSVNGFTTVAGSFVSTGNAGIGTSIYSNVRLVTRSADSTSATESFRTIDSTGTATFQVTGAGSVGIGSLSAIYRLNVFHNNTNASVGAYQANLEVTQTAATARSILGGRFSVTGRINATSTNNIYGIYGLIGFSYASAGVTNSGEIAAGAFDARTFNANHSGTNAMQMAVFGMYNASASATGLGTIQNAYGGRFIADYGYPANFTIQNSFGVRVQSTNSTSYPQNSFGFYEDLASAANAKNFFLNPVGIGTSSPTQNLHVQGNARLTGGLYDNNNSAGSLGQILSSTGSGIAWTSVNTTGILTANGGISNRVTKFLDEDTLGNSNITDTGSLITLGSGVTVSGILTSFGYYGPGTFITNLNASNLASGTVPSSVVSGSYSGITSVGNLTQLNVTGITTSNIFVGNGSNITNLNAVNLASGIVASARISGSYSGITSVGSLTQLNVGGISTIQNLELNGWLLDANNSAGTTGQILSSTGSGIAWTSVNTTGILTATGGISNRVTKFLDEDTLGNSNITDTGTLITLGSGVTVSGILTSFGFFGPGTNITNLNASNLASGIVPSSVVSGSYSGITSVGSLTQLNVTGITTSNIFVGNGSNITNLNASNLASGIVASTRVSGSYSGITSVGSLTQLNVGGISTIHNLELNGWLLDANNSSGTTGQILSSTGSGIAWTSVNTTGILTANGGISNRVTKFLDEDTLGNSNITDTGTLITLGSGVTVSGILTSFGFFGPGTNITNLNASNLASGTVPSAVISGSYSGITSVGSLTQLNVTGITTSNIFVGNGSNITNLNASNLASGTVPSSVVSGSYSGITSVGTLSQLNVSGITTSSIFVGNGSNITNLNASNLTSGIVNTNRISGSYSGITSVGTLTQLNVAGITTSTSVRISNQLYDSNFSSGTANQILISTGNAIVWTSVNVTGILTANGGISNRVTKFLDEDTLGNSNITDTGTLITLGSGVTVSGILTSFGFFGPGTFITNLNASNLASGTVPSTVISGAYSGITSVGNLTQLNVTGITTSNIFVGNGSNITNLNAVNLASGVVPSSVISGSYSGITSVGSLTQLNVTGITTSTSVRISNQLYDSNFSSGTQNQLLISTGVGISWTSTTATGIITGTGDATRVAYFADANTLTSNSDFIVNSFGFIGISTNIPRQRLDVFATARFSGNVLFYGSTSNDAIGLTQTFDTIYQGTNNVLRFRQGGSVAGALAFSFFDDLPAIFMVYNTINSPRVGIGTTGPLQTLHVGGNALISGITTSLGFSGFGTGLANLNASNLAFGTVPSAVVSGSYSGITSVGNLTQLNVTGITTSNIFVGNGSNITNLNAVNLASGIVPSAVVSGTYSGITSVGSLTQLNVTGITSLNSVRISNQLYDSNFSSGTANQILISTGNAIVWTSVNVTGILTANGGISNRVSKFLDEDTLGNSNITDTGTLITLGSGVTVSGILTSFGFFGPGTNITNLNASNIASGTVPSAVVSGSYSGITSVGNLTQLNVTGITTSNIFVGNGSNITNLNAVNLASGIVPSAVISGSYSGITSVGSLTQLNVTGITSSTSVRISNQLYDSNFSSGTANQILISTGNAIVWTSVNVTGILTATGGISNRVTKFLDEDTLGNSNITDTGTLITLGSGVTVSGILTSFGFFGPGTNITNLNASNLASGTVPSAVISGSYSGITSVGSLTQLNVTGITSTVNLRLSGILFDNNFSSGTQNQVLISTGAGVAWTNSNSTGILTGSGAINVVPKFSGPNSLTTSNITDNGLAVTVASRLNVVGVGSFTNDLIVNQMTVGLGSQQSTGNVAIGFQAFQTASPSASGNVAVGDRAMQTTSNAIFANVAVGQLALAVNQANRNVALGAQALYSNTTGASNIAIGYQALFSNTTDLGNIAIGNRVMRLVSGSVGANIAIGGAENLTTAGEITVVGASAANNYTSQGQHVAIGAYALGGVSTFTATGTQNTAVGYAVMTGITGGSSNVGLGHFALNALTSGNSNTGLGYLALVSNTTGSFNVAVGREALRYYTTTSNQVSIGHQALQGSATTTLNTGTENVAVGYRAGFANTSGAQNTFIGNSAGVANTSGVSNTFVGYVSGASNTTGNSNVAVGRQALYSNASGGSNVAVGQNALFSATTATNNTAVGNQAMFYITTQGNHVAVGSQALAGNSNTTLNTGQFNTAVGNAAGAAVTSGSFNVFVGYNAGSATTSGSSNTFVGSYAGQNNTTGLNNTFVGSTAGGNNRSGINNTVIGLSAASQLTTGSSNCYLGRQAAYYNISGNDNIAIGENAIFYFETSSNQIAIGRNALFGNNTRSLNTGGNNVAIGYAAGTAVTSGIGNVFFGHLAGDTITSGTSNIIIGNQADGTATANYQIALGELVTPTGSNLGAWGGATNATRTDLGVGTFTPLGRIHIETLAAGNMGLYIAGSASQTGDLVEVNATTTGQNYFTITGVGSVGIFTNTPSQAFDVNGAARLRGRLFDGNNTSGTQNQLLISTGVGISWTSATATGIVTGTGTATQVAYWNSANQIAGNYNFVFNGVGSVGINTTSPEYALHVVGTLAATIKSFIIAHPTKPGRKLRYASLEGPENGVYLRGRTDETKIILPEYWRGLVDHDSITVNITPIGTFSKFCVEKIENYVIHIKNKNMFNKKQEYFYVVFGERKDVDKLEVEI